MKISKTERQKQIIDITRKIIGQKGIESLTIQEIAKGLKLTNGALYRHFTSKREILKLVIDDIEKTLLETIDKAAQNTTDPVEKLRGILFSHMSYAEKRKGLTFIIINETLNLRDCYLQQKMYGVVSQYIKRVHAILKEGVDSGVFRNDKNILSNGGLAFFGLVQSMVTFWSLSGYKFTIGKKRIEEMFDVFINGIKP